MKKAKATIELKDLCPQRAEFVIKEKKCKLRPITLLDRQWIDEKFGNKPIVSDNGQVDLEILFRSVYRQLEQDSRAQFPAITTKEINDDGEEEETKLLGWQVLASHVETSEEVNTILKAYMQTVGVSEPIYDRLTEEAVKKNKITTK